MKIYLAGPMRGIKAYNHPAFDAATALLRSEGHDVFSPAEHDRALFPDRDWPNLTGDMVKDGLTSNDARIFLRNDVNWIFDNAQAIALLPGWEKSRGVRVEHALAQYLGLYIREIF